MASVLMNHQHQLIKHQRHLIKHQRLMMVHQRPSDSLMASSELMPASISLNSMSLNGFQGQAGALAGYYLPYSWPLCPGLVNY